MSGTSKLLLYKPLQATLLDELSKGNGNLWVSPAILPFLIVVGSCIHHGVTHWFCTRFPNCFFPTLGHLHRLQGGSELTQRISCLVRLHHHLCEASQPAARVWFQVRRILITEGSSRTQEKNTRCDSEICNKFVIYKTILKLWSNVFCEHKAPLGLNGGNTES